MHENYQIIENTKKKESNRNCTIQKERRLSASGRNSRSQSPSQNPNSSRSRHQPTTHTDEDMREIFKIFDKNGDGQISLVELKHVLSNLGERLNDNELMDMMNEADIDGDGLIDYDEFCQMIARKKQ